MTMAVGAIDPAGVMAGAGDDVAVAVAEPFRRVADGGDASLVEGRRVELADDLAVELHPEVGAEPWRLGHQLVDHRLQRLEDMAA